MARHRKGLKRWLDLKPRAHAALSRLTLGRPALARRLDFFPVFTAPPPGALLHDDEITAPMMAPRYAAPLALLCQHSRETPVPRTGIPPFPRIRRVVWQVPDVYIPGRILHPVDLAQGAILAMNLEGPTNWAWTRPRPFRRAPRRIEGRAILIPRMKHYGHLLFDHLVNIAFAVHLGLITREKPVTLVHARRDNPAAERFAKGMLRLGLARDVLRLGHDESALCDAYLHCDALAESGEHNYAFPEATPVLRDILVAGGDPLPALAPSRVYLTRGASKLRRVEGEDRLVALLRDRGFHVFESRWGNLAEQLAVFSRFDMLVGVHGAGLVNAVFGKPSATLVEIMAFDARKTTCLHWASCAGMGYAPVLGGPEGARQSFAIDPQAVAAQIDALAT